MAEKINTSAGSGEIYVYELKIPKERVAVLIGTKGQTKRALQSATKTKIEVDSTEGMITLSGRDALGLYTAREIIMAVGRGFSPERAQTLLGADSGYEAINLRDFARNDDDLVRLRGRIIGEEGKTRRIIEEMTGVYISVYGKTVAMIGPLEGMSIARRAVEAILSGQRHAAVYKWLEKQRRNMREREMLGSHNV